MKTLLTKNKQEFLTIQQRQQDDKYFEVLASAPQMIIKPLKPKLDRITSSHITTKIIKGIPPKSAIEKWPQEDFGIVGQHLQLAQQPFFNEQNEAYQKTQEQAQKFMIREEDQLRAQTAPEGVKREHISSKPRDFKEMIYRFRVQNDNNNYDDFEVPIEKQQEDAYNVNQSVHKHILRLKSSQPLARNLSQQKQKVLNVGDYLKMNRPAVSQQGHRQKIEERQEERQNEIRPKTSVLKQNYVVQTKSARGLKKPPTAPQMERKNVRFGSAVDLKQQWVSLTQKVMEEKTKVQIKPGQVEVAEEVKEVNELNIVSDELTAQEKEYIKKKRNDYLDDLRPFINVIQLQQQQLKQQQLLQNSNANKHNSILSNFESFEDIDQKEESFDMLEDDLELVQGTLKGVEIKPLYHDADSINESFVNNLKDTKMKFKELAEVDARQQIEKQERLRNQPEQFLKYGENISKQEIDFVLKEFKKEVEVRNYELLDTIAKQLKFFQKFSKQTRILLLRLSQIVHYNAKEFIFREGDEGDLMYIIISGACHVRVHNKYIVNEDDPVVVTLYDGQQFGELALIDNQDQKSKVLKANVAGKGDFDQKANFTMEDVRREIKDEQIEKENAKNWWKKEKQGNDFKSQLQDAQAAKRSASIETAEQTYLLTISRDYFQSILLNLITQELEDKLKTLLVLPCFDFMSPMQLIPIANLMETKSYKLGDVILKEGIPQKYFYIVAKGRCKYVKEEIIIRDAKMVGLSKKQRKKRFNFGIIDYQNIQPKGEEKQRVRFNYDYGLEKSKQQKKKNEKPNEKKSFQYEKIHQDENHLAFKYHVKKMFYYGDFVRGDFFMGRALISEYKQLEPSLNELPFDTDEPSRLTVISDSANTIVYVLEKTLIHIIPFPLKKMLIDGVMMKKEFDHFFDHEEGERVKKWDSYKTDLFKWAIDLKNIKKFNYFKMYD